jgi:hypothetical protein
MTGEFGTEASRKRGREETKEGASAGGGEGDKADFWAGFEDSVKGKGFDPAL